MTTVDLLELWERGLDQMPVERAIEVLERAFSEDREALEKLPLGRRDRLLLKVREKTFGPRMDAVTECTACAARIEMEFSTEEIRTPEIAGDQAIEVQCDGYRLQLRLPNSLDIMATAALPLEAGAANLFERCVIEARKEEQGVSTRELPAEVVETALEHMSRIDPQADTRLAVECPECGAANRAPLDIGAYLGREIDAFAVRVLREVHALASAYGWDEKRILEMSPARRRCYLEMVRA